MWNTSQVAPFLPDGFAKIFPALSSFQTQYLNTNNMSRSSIFGVGNTSSSKISITTKDYKMKKMPINEMLILQMFINKCKMLVNRIQTISTNLCCVIFIINFIKNAERYLYVMNRISNERFKGYFFFSLKIFTFSTTTLMISFNLA